MNNYTTTKIKNIALAFVLCSSLLGASETTVKFDSVANTGEVTNKGETKYLQTINLTTNGVESKLLFDKDKSYSDNVAIKTQVSLLVGTQQQIF